MAPESGIPKGLAAPVIGPWIPVNADQSVFGDNVNPEARSAMDNEKGKTAEQKLEEFFENAGVRPDRSAVMDETLGEADMELVEVTARIEATHEGEAATKPVFKKRVRKKN
eukprot:Protomagalhaensia_sp_Gyna_25__5497@NODE_732_length_2742_cov_52_870144_g571_i0_p3_GENE_NODE_732_length_2742_cov_52_870144_g571_i0NODE_732_length_2742_cov_52_870144_g571_i0_p3_ORF_typecomplete_len111_score26_13_NODE_732_length_2742_cov_52_870144_g571_i07401072